MGIAHTHTLIELGKGQEMRQDEGKREIVTQQSCRWKASSFHVQFKQVRAKTTTLVGIKRAKTRAFIRN